jgi:anti-anti-sigma factor
MGDISVRSASTFFLSITTTDPPAGAPAPAEVIISIGGELDRCTAPTFEACLGRLLGSGASAMLTVDLARTGFLDAGGLKALIAAARRASAIDRPLRLVGCSRRVLRLIDIVGAADLFATVAVCEQPVAAPRTSPRTAHPARRRSGRRVGTGI